jgi:hypothetical protein
MYQIVNPQQARLFDPFDPILTEKIRKRLFDGWPGVFRHVILELMPVDTRKDSESRRLLRQQVAEDMYALVQRFSDHPEQANRDTYQALERIFYEQCDVNEEKVSLKQKTGGRVMQNPSDPDATYDGHKGQGYQVQIAETCNLENDVQIITAALPQTASESDAYAVEPVLEHLFANNLGPDELLTDTGYTGNENVQLAEEYGVELVGPVPTGSSKSKDDDYAQLTIDDFVVDDDTEEVVCCPAGHQPHSTEHNNETGKTKTVMPESACNQCECFEQCPAKKGRDGYPLDHTAKERRTAGRRRETATDIFRERYKTRGGIEGANSGLKRKTGLGQLRVRGRPAVFHAIYLKIAGWNILRASACAKMREIMYERANAVLLKPQSLHLRIRIAEQILRRGPRNIFSIPFRPSTKFSRSRAAA